MRLKIITIIVMSLSLAGVASAHRLDEFLQATLISVEKDHVKVSMRLIPGVGVSSAVITSVDTDGDGVLSTTEQWAYAERVPGDLVLTVDGERVKLKLVSVAFPQIEQMRDGVGEIRLEFTGDLPRGGPDRKLILESHQQNKKAVYLVNCLVPRDRDIRIVAQKRNEQQSFYELDYVQDGVSSRLPLSPWWTSVRGAMSALGLPSLFRLDMRHIAEGTDHLLFLLVLLLPAPLMVAGSRWAGIAGVRSSVFRILSIVTSFTIGHSITLALAAFGLVRVPSRPIEVLIAVSILLSAIHALRSIFPGKEAGIAAFFGLIHGLAFASTLSELGLERWGAGRRDFGVQPGYRNDASGRSSGDHSVSASDEPHTCVSVLENERRTLRCSRVCGLDRGATARSAKLSRRRGERRRASCRLDRRNVIPD